MNAKEDLPQKTRPARDIAGFTAVGVIFIGCVLLIVALLIPPPGEIDNSVLVAFGEICTFAGTVFGVAATRKKQRLGQPESFNGKESLQQFKSLDYERNQEDHHSLHGDPRREGCDSGPGDAMA